MKLHALGASAVALALAFISPAHAEINKVDKMFIILTTGTVIQTSMCKDYDVVAGAPQKYADMNGADFDSLKGPVFAAIKAQIGGEYDRSDLVPEVTQLVRGTFDEMASDFDRNKPAACNKWGKLLMPSGLLRRK
jgi:hypothetical protein